jgi:two-component system, sensor histidine kinase and response regulator
MQKILIVDDNLKNRAIMEELFRDEYRVFHAEDGLQALDMISEEKPDVILLDIMMPGLTGYQVCQKIKTNPETSAIPVIIISAKGRTEEIIEGFESQADDYIVRPFINSELRARVRATLRLKMAQDQLRSANQALQEHSKKLEEANERLKELDRLKAGFTAMLVHDLRSPLAVVQVALQMMDGKAEALGDEYVGLIKEAIISCNGLFNLTNDLLEGFRSESGAISLQCRTGKVLELVDEPFRHAQVLAIKKHVEMRKELTGSLPEISVDFYKLQRAVANLLGNAVKFTHKNGLISLRVYLQNSDQESGVQLIVEIQDSGDGIHPDDMEFVFAPYYQGKSAASGVGAGLGLFIAKRLVEAHGGNIHLTSKLNVGSCFRICLPLNKIQPTDEAVSSVLD